MSRKNQRGATLVGVLIAMIVAGIGLYALMQTQGEMSGGISASKARAEAMQVAQKTFESQRAYIHSDQFDSDLTIQAWGACNSVSDFTGVNADFVVECRISDATVGNYKQAMVRVRWTDEASNPQSVSLNNYILFQDPSLLASIKQENEDGIPQSTLARRGRWGDERVEKGTEDETRDDNTGTLVPGTTELYRRTNSKGNWELYVYNGSSSYVVLTAFGGIIHHLSGKIHFEEASITQADLVEMSAIATSPAYCAPLCATDCSAEASATDVEYHCFYPGSCAEEVDSSNGEFIPNLGVNDDCKGELSDEAVKIHLADIKALDLNGGWYGKVGLFGISEKPFDDILTGDSCEDPARNYVSIRLCDSGDICTHLMANLTTIHGSGNCEYQKDCKFQDSTDTGNSKYTGYISHCVGNPKDQEVIDGYCIDPDPLDPTVDGDPYGIYENEGINGSYAYNHFWLIDGDLNTKSCSDNLDRFSQSATVAVPATRTEPPYLVDHNLVRPLGFNVDPFADITPWPSDDNGEPANVITEPNDMGLVDHIPPPHAP